MAEQALEAQLARLQLAWVTQMQAELAALAQQAKQLEQQTTIGSLELQPLRDQLHKIAGSAGTFGYPELGQQARRLEQHCRQLLSCSDLCGNQLQQLAAGLATLPDLLQQKTDYPAAIIPNPENPSSRPQVHVLIVADDPHLLAEIDQTLTNYGYLTCSLPPGENVDQFLQQNPVAALLVDISPGSRGAALLPALASLHASGDNPVPLLAISNQRTFNCQIAAIRAGAVGFFPTPLDLIALEECLDHHTHTQQDAPYRVLLVDDDHTLAQRYRAVLHAAGMEVEWVDQPAALLQHLHDFHPDLVLMDIHMPDYSGIELAQLIRLNHNWLRIPIIYLSAEADSSRQLAALLKAGDDFFSKPISDQKLVTNIYARAQRARLLSQALTRDSMTGLLKHADIKEQIELEIERAQRQRLPVSIVMIDIDHFKAINDQHGHTLGDSVIRALASLLRQRLRRIDRIGRYGGEEFAAVLPNCGAADAQLIFDQIREAFASLQFRAPEGSFQSSFSAGISACEAPNWQATGLLEQADKHLYLAKRKGRNQVVAREPGPA